MRCRASISSCGGPTCSTPCRSSGCCRRCSICRRRTIGTTGSSPDPTGGATRSGTRLKPSTPCASAASAQTNSKPSSLLGLLQVDRGDLAALLLKLVADLLALAQAVQPGALDRRDVHEHVLAAVRGLDEAVAFG